MSSIIFVIATLLPHVWRGRRVAPKSMYYSEGMLNIFEPNANSVCAREPILAGLSGENFRAAFDHHGQSTVGITNRSSLLSFMNKKVWLNPAGIVRKHIGRSTGGINDHPSLLSFMNKKVWLNPAGIVHKHIEDRHRAEREAWCSRQLSLGIPPAQVPNIFYAEWQSMRRNASMRTVNGITQYVINVIGGPKILNLAGRIGADERRHERIHYELMKACSPELAHHRFAQQRWDPALDAPKTDPAEFGSRKAVVRSKLADWRTHLHQNLALKKAVQTDIRETPDSSPLWEIVDKSRMMAYLDRPESAHIERFCYFGALTSLHFLNGKTKVVKMRNAYLAENPTPS